ncbi:MAG: hypothetical protein QW802_03720 [Candidatus Altiarchaeota archaeon]
MSEAIDQDLNEVAKETLHHENSLNKKNAEALLRMSEISLWLDSYDDIFSDFDPRPYSERALSDDFLSEAKKASRGKASGMIELKLLIPKHNRDESKEKIIKRRLRDHFRKHSNLLGREIENVKKKGILFTLFGILLMVLATTVLFNQPEEKNFLMSLIVVILEPAGWFLFWHGLDTALFESNKIRPEFEFYQKMSNCDIIFLEY